MRNVHHFYHRLDEWTRNLSRGGYAALIGAVSTLSYLLVSILFGELETLKAVTMGVTLTILFYASNPNQKR